MKISLITFIMLLSLPAHTKCKDIRKFINAGSHAVAAAINCDFKNLIREDLAKMIPATQLCQLTRRVKVKPKNSCIGLGAVMATAILMNGVPDSWGCHADMQPEHAEYVGKDVRELCLEAL